MPRRPILSPEAPPPSGGYSQGIVAGDLLYLSGQGPYDASGARVGTTVAEQVRQVLANLDAVERNIARMQGYCDQHGLAFRPHIKTHKLPARTTIQSDLVDFDVEGDAVVLLGD